MLIKPYCSDWAVAIADIFYLAVQGIGADIYSLEQKQAWAPPPDYAAWAVRLEQKRPFVVLLDAKPFGFIELDEDGYIDCLYVHPDAQGLGLATALYAHLLEQARVQKLTRLYVDASIVARPFFEKRGFRLLQRNLIERGDVVLENFSLEIALI